MRDVLNKINIEQYQDEQQKWSSSTACHTTSFDGLTPDIKGGSIAFGFLSKYILNLSAPLPGLDNVR